MKYPLKCLALFIFWLPTATLAYGQQNEKQLINKDSEEFSLTDYLKENPDEAAIRYQAYLRVRLTVNQDSLQYLLPREVEKIKIEITQNKTDYTKLVYSETQPETKQIVAKNAESSEAKQAENRN